MVTPRRSPLGLVVLLNLDQGPSHVYGLHKLIEATGKNRVVNVRSRASLYQVIERLERYGLVEVVGTVSGDSYPDRVQYAITETGRDVARAWLLEMLSSTGEEFPEFIAGLSVVFALTPDEAQTALERREQKLAGELTATDAELADAPAGLPRLFLLEEEYRRALLEAELAWVRSVIEDLRAGRLTWSEEWLREIGQQFLA